jgi:hypothetical protein
MPHTPMMTFTLTKDQHAKASEWMAAQRATHPADTGAAGGRFSYVFTMTGLGECIEVVDQITGERLNVTDYSDW